MRLIPRSLQGRMLMLSAAATLVALAIAAIAVGRVLERFVIAGLDRRLDSEVSLLAGTVDASGRIDERLLSQRLALFEAEPGWRWRIATPAGTRSSTDFPILDSEPPDLDPRPDGAAWRHHPHPHPTLSRLHPRDGDDEGSVPVHAREVTIQTNGGPVTLTVAAPRGIVRRPIRDALGSLLGALVALAALLATATIVQLRLGLRPIRRMRDQVAAIRGGRRERVDENQPSELQPLAEELNALAADNAAALTAARLSAANLAHALKTPVAALALEVRDDPHRQALVARIDTTIRHHLARARADATNRRSSTELAPVLHDLADAVRRLHGDRLIAIIVDASKNLEVAVDRQDLDEIVGNLLDNAARHARSMVTVAAHAHPANSRAIVIDIADDGAGVPAEAHVKIIQPGTRLDERSDGHGFGLSIVTNLVSLYGGTITFSGSPEGGLAVRVTLSKAVSVSE